MQPPKDRPEHGEAEDKERLDERLDEALEESFPASDPPELTQPHGDKDD